MTDINIGFDMSSFIWRGLLAGKDLENGIQVTYDDKPVLVNSGMYGYDNVMNMMLEVVSYYAAAPVSCVLVFEGLNSKSRRMLIDPEYKAERDSRAPEAYEQFGICCDLLKKAWLEVGATVVTQDYCEGDDTLGWMADNAECKFVIATFDGDMTVCNGTNKHGAEVEVWINGLRGVNKYGDFPHHLVTAYKALVGDGKEYKGCKGFGPAAFLKFVEAYGIDGLQEFQDLCIAGSLDPLHAMDDKLVQLICASEENVLRSFQLALLHPEWVDTLLNPIQITRSLVSYPPPKMEADDRLTKWYAKTWLVDADTFDKAADYLRLKLHTSPFITLDIETSTPDESDDWLAAKGTPDGVDVFGSELTGISLTFGDNTQYTMYFSVDHADTKNVGKDQIKQLLEWIGLTGKPIVIQNVSFELVVLFNSLGPLYGDNPHASVAKFKGYLPNVLDTALEASYVDENNTRGLKARSMSVLGYKQITYDEVTKIEGEVATLPRGGRLISEVEASERVDTVDGVDTVVAIPHTQVRRYKMRELTAQHVLDYGADDTRCTAALHLHYKFVMQNEHTYNVYQDVEIDAAYLHAQSFITGVAISVEKLNLLSAIDDKTHKESWAKLRQYLIEKGWEGTVPPVYTKDITPAEIKSAYTIVTGKPLDTAIRTVSKIVTFIREIAGNAVFAGMLERCVAGESEAFTSYVCAQYKNEPVFNDDSSKQMQSLLYETMGLPIRIRNKPTAPMKAKGIFLGSPKTDALAISYAMMDATDEQKDLLDALKLLAMVGTRRSLYYSKYPNLPHWKDGKVHSSHNQCGTNTRRASSSDPNLQQLPKHQKIEGQASRFREVIVPHHSDAVVVSLDFSAQELRVIADYSKDPNMVDCYVGDNLKGLHELTGLSIYCRTAGVNITYEEYMAIMDDKTHPNYKLAKECRTLGKKTNFTSEYGAMAPKLAQTLLVTEDVAQTYLDAREEAFPVAAAWKVDVVREAKLNGFVMSMLGARRHLRDALQGSDRYAASKAERQAVNFKVQGSSAEMTKLAEARMWKAGIFDNFDAICYGPIHDEVVASVAIKDLVEFLPLMHKAMVAPYGGMTIPIESSISFGRNFFEQIEIGNTPTAAAIEAGILELRKQNETHVS
jgi:DNA polymerase I-like protein with 3'-5' exonuclease and polymerase domains